MKTSDAISNQQDKEKRQAHGTTFSKVMDEHKQPIRGAGHHVNRIIESRLKENMSPRTINLDVIGLRVVLKRAMSDGLIQRLPTEGLRSLKTSTEKRALFTAADLDTLCKSAFESKKNKKG